MGCDPAKGFRDAVLHSQDMGDGDSCQQLTEVEGPAFRHPLRELHGFKCPVMLRGSLEATRNPVVVLTTPIMLGKMIEPIKVEPLNPVAEKPRRHQIPGGWQCLALAITLEVIRGVELLHYSPEKVQGDSPDRLRHPRRIAIVVMNKNDL